MMEPMPFGNITSALADSFGLSQGTVGAIIIFLFAPMFMLFSRSITGSTALGFLTGWVITGLGAMLGLCPWWVVAAYGVFPGAFVILPLSSYVAVSTAKQSAKNLVELTLRIEKASQKWAEYHNNLDGLLGITTSNGMTLAGLNLTVINELLIQQDYDWYITDKIPDQDIFKIVGLHKKDASKNLVYLLGKNKETGKPFLTRVSSLYLEDSIGECIDHGISSTDDEAIGLRKAKPEPVKVSGSRIYKITPQGMRIIRGSWEDDNCRVLHVVAEYQVATSKQISAAMGLEESKICDDINYLVRQGSIEEVQELGVSAEETNRALDEVKVIAMKAIGN